MENYIINHALHGFNMLKVDSPEVKTISNSLVIYVLSKAVKDNVKANYNNVAALLKNHNRVIFIGDDTENNTFKSVASLMVTYGAYDIYSIADISDITGPYVKTLIERTPDITEIRTYIGGDVSAYNDIIPILFGFESFVEQGDSENLKKFIEEHMSSIENMSSVINNLKKKADLLDSDELFDKIESLNKNNEVLEGQIKAGETKLSEVKHERDGFKTMASENGKKVKELTEKVAELSGRENYGSILNDYKEENTQLMRCTAKIVLYFKEVTYVKYVDSFITQLVEWLKVNNLKTKFIIYDTSTKMYRKYQPLTVADGKTYVADKDTLINKAEKFVVAEPIPAILHDILESPLSFDVVIIYDRMHNTKDLISGNNVTKFFIINSNHDFMQMKDTLKISSTGNIITSEDSTIEGSDGKKWLNIPYIEGYTSLTDSAKIAKYQRAHCKNHNQTIFKYLIEKSNISALLN